jgi:kynureninase
MNFPTLRSGAEQFDAQDSLATLRDHFHVPAHSDKGAYLCGHSLGLQPKAAAGLVQEELERWARFAVDGHFATDRPWLSYHEALAAPLARLAGASPLEVVVMNTLSVNLHLMLISFYRPTGSRRKILIEQNAFSSDRYAVASQIRHHGLDPAEALLEAVPRHGEETIRTEDLCGLIEREGPQLATVLLPGVQYLSGQLFDLQEIARCARRAGCMVGFDLAHAIGNVPLALHDWDVDFAVWCSYKYLNAGPGAIGGAFVHERHARTPGRIRLAGWWGHDKESRFAMPHAFQPLPGAEGWQVSNIPVLSCAPLLASLPLFDQAGMAALRRKSLALTGYLAFLLERRLAHAVSILTPAQPQARGCQLSLRLKRPTTHARATFEALTRRGFVGDWRAPDVIRVAPVPMYNRFVEVWDFVAALEQCLQ